jgi:hypothetical protein
MSGFSTGVLPGGGRFSAAALRPCSCRCAASAGRTVVQQSSSIPAARTRSAGQSSDFAASTRTRARPLLVTASRRVAPGFHTSSRCLPPSPRTTVTSPSTRTSTSPSSRAPSAARGSSPTSYTAQRTSDPRTVPYSAAVDTGSFTSDPNGTSMRLSGNSDSGSSSSSSLPATRTWARRASPRARSGSPAPSS